MTGVFHKIGPHLKHVIVTLRGKVPAYRKKEFNDRINTANVARAKLISLLFIFLEIPLIILSAVCHGRNVFALPELAYFLMYCMMLLAMLAFLFAFRRVGRNVASHEAEIRVLGVVFSLFILCWCAGISILDQMSSGQIMVYVFAIIAVAVTPYFRPPVLLGMYLAVQAAFVACLVAASPPSKTPVGNIVNSTTFVFVAWAISAMRYRERIIMFGSKKLIERKNAELSRMNLRLREANEKLRILSRADGLTGIANRLAFDETVCAEWERCARLSQPLTLFMVDIDFFKNYNDHYGHQAGDECLRRVAAVLSSSARRTSDTAARYGGEEFVLILPYLGEAEAKDYSGQIVRSVEAMRLPHGYSSVSPFVTISLGGCTVFPVDGGSVAALIGNADKALYLAKEQRNRAVMFSAQP